MQIFDRYSDLIVWTAQHDYVLIESHSAGGWTVYERSDALPLHLASASGDANADTQ